jgi:hypothetical protein
MTDAGMTKAAVYRVRAIAADNQPGAWSQPVSVSAAPPPTTQPPPTPVGQLPTPPPVTLALGCQNLLEQCGAECALTNAALLECTCVAERHVARCAPPPSPLPPGSSSPPAVATPCPDLATLCATQCGAAPVIACSCDPSSNRAVTACFVAPTPAQPSSPQQPTNANGQPLQPAAAVASDDGALIPVLGGIGAAVCIILCCVAMAMLWRRQRAKAKLQEVYAAAGANNFYGNEASAAETSTNQWQQQQQQPQASTEAAWSPQPPTPTNNNYSTDAWQSDATQHVPPPTTGAWSPPTTINAASLLPDDDPIPAYNTPAVPSYTPVPPLRSVVSQPAINRGLTILFFVVSLVYCTQ